MIPSYDTRVDVLAFLSQTTTIQSCSSSTFPIRSFPFPSKSSAKWQQGRPRARTRQSRSRAPSRSSPSFSSMASTASCTSAACIRATTSGELSSPAFQLAWSSATQTNAQHGEEVRAAHACDVGRRAARVHQDDSGPGAWCVVRVMGGGSAVA